MAFLSLLIIIIITIIIIISIIIIIPFFFWGGGGVRWWRLQGQTQAAAAEAENPRMGSGLIAMPCLTWLPNVLAGQGCLAQYILTICNSTIFSYGSIVLLLCFLLM